MSRILALLTFCIFLSPIASLGQDILFKLDGEQVEVKVSEITPSEVKYKLTSNPDGPTYVLPKTEVYMVEYANGSKDVFGVKSKPVDEIAPPKIDSAKRSAEEKEYRSRKGGGIAGVIIGSVFTVVSVPLLVDGIIEVTGRNGKPTQAIAAGFTTLFGIIGLGSGIDQLVKASELKIRLMNSTSSLHISPELMNATTYNGPLIQKGSGVGVRFTYRL
jgi:hypothetical protein